MLSKAHAPGFEPGYHFSGNCTREDLPSISRLLSRVFKKPLSEEYLAWKYLGNTGEPCVSALARCNGEIIGFIGVIPTTFIVDGKVIPAGHGGDLAIDESHRRLDVFMGLLAQTESNARTAHINFLYGFMSPEVMEINEVLSFQNLVGRVPRLVRILEPAAAFTVQSLPPLLRPLAFLHALMLFAWFLEKDRRPPAGTRITNISRFDKRIDRFQQHTPGEEKIAVVHDHRFLNWRLVDIPQKRIHILCVENVSGSEILGYIALAVEQENGVQRGKIMDFSTHPNENPAVVRALLDAALRWFKKESAGLVDCWIAPGSRRYAEMVRRGFLSGTNDSVRLYCNQIDSPSPQLAQILACQEHWRLSLCDSDFHTIESDEN